MSTEINKILIKLNKYHDTWLQMAKNLLYIKDDHLIKDVVQEMYVNIYDQLKENKLNINNIIIDNQPHFGIVKTVILRIIQHNNKNQSKLKKVNEGILNNIEDKSHINVDEFENKIKNILDDMHWFDRKLFKLYVKDFNSVRKLSTETKLGHTTVYKTLKKCRNKIKKGLNEN